MENDADHDIGQMARRAGSLGLGLLYGGMALGSEVAQHPEYLDGALAAGRLAERPAYVLEQGTYATRGDGTRFDISGYQVDLPTEIAGIPGQRERVAQEKEWTVLVYSAADNNLSTHMYQNIDEMERVGSTDQMNVVVQYDRGDNTIENESAPWSGARRYFVQQDQQDATVTSPVLEELGQVDMASPKALYDFVSWGVKNYPAENYMLIIADHGAGWMGVIDDQSADSGPLSWEGIRQALTSVQRTTGEKIDVLGFDACLMASTEGAYAVRGVARYMVASESVINAGGWDYEGLLNEASLVMMEKGEAGSELSPRQMALLVVDEVASEEQGVSTMSAIDLEKMPAVAEAIDRLAGAIIEYDTPYTELKEVFFATHQLTNTYFGGTSMVDVYDLAHKIVANGNIEGAVRATAKDVLTTVEGAVLDHRTSEFHERAHGLHIYLPRMQEEFDKATSAYKATSFAQDTRWDEFHDTIAKEKHPSGAQNQALYEMLLFFYLMNGVSPPSQ